MTVLCCYPVFTQRHVPDCRNVATHWMYVRLMKIARCDEHLTPGSKTEVLIQKEMEVIEARTI